MLNQELNTSSTTKLVKQVLLKGCKLKVLLDQKIVDKIKFLCKEIPKEEWSGVLFYHVEGTITDPRNMVITLKDLFPMDKGSAAFTEYAYGEDVVGYRMDNPETNLFKVGHIHSHDVMSVFFSGTDTSELHDNSPFHNYYLSVIVNDYFDIDARLAFRGNKTVTTIVAMDDNGEPYSFPVNEPEEIMFYYECEIIKDDPFINVDEQFKNRVKHIITEAAKPKVVNHPASNLPATTKQPDVRSSDWWKSKTVGSEDKKGLISEKAYNAPKRYVFENMDDSEKANEYAKALWEDNNFTDMNDKLDELDARTAQIEDFLITLLTSFPDHVNEIQRKNLDFQQLDDVFSFLRQRVGKKGRTEYLNFIFENFVQAYTQELLVGEVDDLSTFSSDLDIMIQLVEEYAIEYVNAQHFNTQLGIFKLELQKNGTRQTNKV